MEKYKKILQKSHLFKGIKAADVDRLLACLSAETTVYGKGEFVFQAGEVPPKMGIVLSGCVHIIKEDYWGNRSILSEVQRGELFAESYACLEAHPLDVGILAVEKTEVMLVNYGNIVSRCSPACEFHWTMTMNMLRILAGKNARLMEKMEHITKRATRDKVLSYLSGQARQNGSSAFHIPFNRQEFADYLSVERSALSAELSKMRAAGMIEYRKNYFELLV
jgi:CRP-like cAMP-binding protein